MNKITDSEKECIMCTIRSDRLYFGFLDDSIDRFHADSCLGCKRGIVPVYINTNQVIKYLKLHFKKRNINIEEYRKEYFYRRI